jgi:hypothetical protein
LALVASTAAVLGSTAIAEVRRDRDRRRGGNAIA